ncbi:hydrogenase expression/formation protein HypE [Clostridium botulinum]|uniref:Hydrogenase expression/formation protein HypE n=1 Tax=Clostridium botulinum TaxID=1491 RepID=A0A846JBR4_CLOBO|nr:hydrogenase expression/formation protein HypE [Clostridium botulinum]ACA54466.1 hydrogenase expression/formation protein HypE [Clostridium botulinum A3 str. Loch Maree]NFH66965.1 hydrogenase expression/formation protein HypE [Clostridium botulinum]NFJ10530.1 hydrogenase expression/formation protein HypE [Clostridium botulinum]NFK15218.1 hydrogenase expression/formation protein HypE [Clostridium botulinum]NFM95038.1 hydrogenase expression/formation protein HypE [Clostridium botulinum]
MNGFITLNHGHGGKYTHELIEELMYKYFNNKILIEGIDSATFNIKKGKLAFTTDSFVVKPLFFNGGDIGKLAICGTVNDLSVSGAKPLYLSCSFIIEEGFPIEKLEIIVKSMASTAKEANVLIVTGDTKVVEKGSVDQIFINTSGIGIIEEQYSIKNIEKGDKVIVTGNIGDHGTTVALDRYNLNIRGNLKSDCTPVNAITNKLKEYYPYIKIMKDPTRGGVATTLNEISSLSKNLGICVWEDKIPIKNEVKAINEMLGLDPLYMACEGRIVMVVKDQYAKDILKIIKEIDNCKNAEIIGTFVKNPYNIVYVENFLGGTRIINMLEGDMLPRIC